MAIKSIVALFVAGTLIAPATLSAYTYNTANIHYAYHEAPESFSVDIEGNATGSTVSGMLFQQYTVVVDPDIRLQRFEVGFAHWYISDHGIIWADDDLSALSIYLSRVV